MSSGMISIDALTGLLEDQVPNPDGIMSIFAGSVYWESKNEFFENCSKGGEHALERLLDVRAYDENSEFRAVRDSIDNACMLSWRTVSDEDFEDPLDDVQYLDIDAKQSNVDKGEYCTTGGGKYSLPLANAERVKVRNYISYDEDGLARLVDFRIVGLLRGGEE